MIPFLNTGTYGQFRYVGYGLLLAAGVGNLLIDCEAAEATVEEDKTSILQVHPRNQCQPSRKLPIASYFPEEMERES